MQTKNSTASGFIILFLVQILLIVAYALFARYDELYLPHGDDSSRGTFQKQMDSRSHVPSYKHFQDMNVMVIVGFGFLMSFLKKYGFSATGFTLFIACLSIQLAMLVRGCFHLSNGYIRLSLDDMIGSLVAAAVNLISMGAVLGRASLIQLAIMAMIETVIFSANEFFQYEIVKLADAGGSITLHAFGAYFGLGLSWMLKPKAEQTDSGKNEGASYISDITAMIGTLFLWVYWPSFNTAGLDADQQMRGIINTYMSITASAVVALVISSLVNSDNKLNMVHVQNATLAGGVVSGAVCNLLIGPHGALMVGTTAGIISTLGYQYLTPLLVAKLNLHDTCGVNNLHGMPAILSGIFSAIYASLATKELYKNSLTEIFPAMSDVNSTLALEYENVVIGGFGRTASQQAGFQLVGVALTVIIALSTGLLTGVFLKWKIFKQIEREDQHDDKQSWLVGEEH